MNVSAKKTACPLAKISNCICIKPEISIAIFDKKLSLNILCTVDGCIEAEKPYGTFKSLREINVFIDLFVRSFLGNFFNLTQTLLRVHEIYIYIILIRIFSIFVHLNCVLISS